MGASAPPPEARGRSPRCPRRAISHGCRAARIGTFCPALLRRSPARFAEIATQHHTTPHHKMNNTTASSQSPHTKTCAHPACDAQISALNARRKYCGDPKCDQRRRNERAAKSRNWLEGTWTRRPHRSPAQPSQRTDDEDADTGDGHDADVDFLASPDRLVVSHDEAGGDRPVALGDEARAATGSRVTGYEHGMRTRRDIAASMWLRYYPAAPGAREEDSGRPRPRYCCCDRPLPVADARFDPASVCLVSAGGCAFAAPLASATCFKSTPAPLDLREEGQVTKLRTLASKLRSLTSSSRSRPAPAAHTG